MVEKSGSNPEQTVPARWHDAIRSNVEGTLESSDNFLSFTIEGKYGLQYVILSLTSWDPKFGLDEGVYIMTNIPKEKVDDVVTYATSISLKLATIFGQNQDDSRVSMPVPKEIDEHLANTGAKIDLGNAFRLDIFGYLPAGMVFTVKPVGLSEVSSRIKKASNGQNGFSISKI